MLGVNAFGTPYFGQATGQQLGDEFFTLSDIELEASYIPVIALNAEYAPSQGLDASYIPSIPLNGSVE